MFFANKMKVQCKKAYGRVRSGVPSLSVKFSCCEEMLENYLHISIDAVVNMYLNFGRFRFLFWLPKDRSKLVKHGEI
jgi:hypothetical protein